MEGNASEVQTAAVLIALRTKGETVDELVGLATTMRRLATPVRDRPRRPDRHRRHRRRAADLQRLDHGGADRRRARAARSPSTATARPPGLSGSADVLEALGVRIDLDPEAVARCIERGRLRLHVRARPPRRDALRRAGAQGARRAHDLQLPRPADQPRGRDAAGDRRVRRRRSWTRSRGRWRGWAPRKALVVSSADGLDEMSTSGTTRVVEVDGPRGSLLRGVPRGRRAAARPPGGPGRRHAGPTTPRRRGGSSTGEPGPQRDLAVLNAGAAIYVAGPGRLAGGRRARGRGGDRRRPRGRQRSSGWWT